MAKLFIVFPSTKSRNLAIERRLCDVSLVLVDFVLFWSFCNVSFSLPFYQNFPNQAMLLAWAMVRAPINQAAYLKTKDFACIWLLLVNKRCLLSPLCYVFATCIVFSITTFCICKCVVSFTQALWITCQWNVALNFVIVYQTRNFESCNFVLCFYVWAWFLKTEICIILSPLDKPCCFWCKQWQICLNKNTNIDNK